MHSINFYKKFDTIISKSSNDISQTDPIEMQGATRPDAAPDAV